MKKIAMENIKFEAIKQELEKHENRWVAISGENKVVSSGKTYAEALRAVGGDRDVVLLKVPRLDVFLSP